MKKNLISRCALLNYESVGLRGAPHSVFSKRATWRVCFSYLRIPFAAMGMRREAGEAQRDRLRGTKGGDLGGRGSITQ